MDQRFPRVVVSFVNKMLHRSVVMVHDLLMIPAAWLCAYMLRFNLETVPDWFWLGAWKSLLLVIPSQAAVFWIFGLYRGVWRFASLPDLVRIAKAVLVGVLIAILLLYLVYNFKGVPRSVPIFYGILLMVFLSVPRFVYRWIKDRGFGMGSGERVLIVGAGSAGEMLARDLMRDRERSFLPVVFVDDDRQKWGKEIHGIRVVAGCDQLQVLAAKLSIDVIMLAVPSASASQIRKIVEFAEAAGVPFRTVPQLNDLVSGQVNISQIREVELEDLLGRKPVDLDWDAMRSGLAEHVILVTGAGGSIGTELCNQLAALGASELILIDNSEFNLFNIERSLRANYPAVLLRPHLVDVTESLVVDKVFQRYRPQVVFHAAAYKHVPLLETQIREAVRNNVLGTRNVALAADKSGAEEFVLISTDKAVNPVNVMGTSKRAAEIFCQNFNQRSKATFITVRFGNVLGSTGSVIPLFKEQIAQGGPVTVTDPDVERYFMTTREACQLIMQASVLGSGGEIFVLNMGKPLKIDFLARQLIMLSGKAPDDEITIEYVGLRPGEKLHEELFHHQEDLAPTGHQRIQLAGYRKQDWESLNSGIAALEKASAAYECAALYRLLGDLVPESDMQSAGKPCSLDQMNNTSEDV